MIYLDFNKDELRFFYSFFDFDCFVRFLGKDLILRWVFFKGRFFGGFFGRGAVCKFLAPFRFSFRVPDILLSWLFKLLICFITSRE